MSAVPAALLLSLSLAAGPAPPFAAADLAAIARLIEKGQLEPAEGRLRKILAQGPSPPARALLGIVLSRESRPKEAEEDLLAALAAAPDLLEARQELVRVYVAEGREPDATAELRRAARGGPLPRDLGLKMAAVEMSDGHRAEAEAQLRSVVDRFGSVKAMLQLARLRSQAQDAPAALELLGRALGLAPNSEEVIDAYSQMSLAAGRPVPAVLALEELARMNPTVGSYRYLLGVGLMRAGDFSRAAFELERAEQLEPQRPLTLVGLGLALNGLKRYTEARPFLERSLKIDPDNVEALAALAEAEEGAGDLISAEDHAHRVLERVPPHPTANLVLGMVFMKKEQYAEARDALQRAVAAAPGSPKAHYQLSLALARLGDTASSERQVELYRRSLRENEERLARLRTQTGAPRAAERP